MNSVAGAGKTTYIVKRVKNLIDTLQVPANKILIITYTNSCVNEIKQRINIPISIYTFHEFCLNNIDFPYNFSEKNNLDNLSYDMEIDEDFENFYNHVLPYTPFNFQTYCEILNEIFFYSDDSKKIKLESKYFTGSKKLKKRNDFFPNDEEWLLYRNKILEKLNYMNQGINLEYLKLLLKIEDRRDINKMYTFHHIILYTIKNIQIFVENVLNKYDYIFLDEGQDLSSLQFQIISAIAEEFVYKDTGEIIIVGDIYQSIFSFQGTSTDGYIKFLNFIEKLSNKYNKPIDIINQNKTYRFGGELLKFINKNFSRSHTSIEKYDTKIYLNPLVDNSVILVKKITDTIKYNLNKNLSVLVLFEKRNTLVNLLEDELEGENISVKINKKISSKTNMIIDMRSLILLIITEKDEYMANFLMGGFFHIQEPDFYNLCKQRMGTLWEEVFKKYINKLEIVTLKNLKENKNNVKNFLDILESSILNKNIIKKYGQDWIYFIHNLKNTLYVLPNIYNILHFLDGNIVFNKEGNVFLSTIHTAKGMESDVVIILNANSCNLKDKYFVYKGLPFIKEYYIDNNYFNLQEKQNLYYVAVTRSKQYLHVFGKGLNIQKNTLYDIISRWKTYN
ncbi:hypothetical protein AB836_01080 [Rickettsiales bacterium (ex Bugula neritina AB1)]|nr:hypothetical protein AB836_01080 [Rickettsiales bacterium (ex Bugula neritina AB1)]